MNEDKKIRTKDRVIKFEINIRLQDLRQYDNEQRVLDAYKREIESMLLTAYRHNKEGKLRDVYTDAPGERHQRLYGV